MFSDLGTSFRGEYFCGVFQYTVHSENCVFLLPWTVTRGCCKDRSDEAAACNNASILNTFFIYVSRTGRNYP